MQPVSAYVQITTSHVSDHALWYVHVVANNKFLFTIFRRVSEIAKSNH